MAERASKKQNASTGDHHDPANLIALIQNSGEDQGAAADELQRIIDAMQLQQGRFSSIIGSLAEGVISFDAGNRLMAANRRFADIYRVSPNDMPEGSMLRDIVALCVTAGTSPMPVDEYLAKCDAIDEGLAPDTWIAALSDGRRIRVRHTRMPDGGWVAVHEELANVSGTLANERITLQTLIDCVPDNLWVKDAESRFVIANKRTAQRMGFQATSELIGKSDLELCPPETAEGYFADEQAIIASGEPMIDKEEYVLGSKGEKTWILTTKVPLRDENGEIVGLIGISRDISDRRRADLLRRGQAQILEKIAIGAPLETVLDEFVRLVELQIPGGSGVIELTGDDGVTLHRATAPNVAPDFIGALDGARLGLKMPPCGAAAKSGKPVIIEDMLSDPLWESHRELVSAHPYRSCWSVPILSHAGSVLGVFTVYLRTKRAPTTEELETCEASSYIAGIAIERMLSEQRIRTMATHDALTGLPNRLLLVDRLKQNLLLAERNGGRVTVAFIDLDGFKLVNDTLGHSAGDFLLKTVSDRMVSCVRAADTVARLGGDEFVILLAEHADKPNSPVAILDRIRTAVAEPISIEGQMFRVTASMGVATSPVDGADAEGLLLNADVAMYEAKNKGRDNCQFYESGMNDAARERRVLEDGLRAAVVNQDFTLAYQPQIDLKTGKIFAVEALARWTHPTIGNVPPATFIPLAEEIGLIIPIGDWVLREACRQNKAWQLAGMPPVAISVNVSAAQFRDIDWLRRITETLTDTGLDPKYLELELTESMLMHDVSSAISTMRRLETLGVRLSIDDFGTGYSSLSSLKNFPVARLKIDRSFVRDLPSDPNDQRIVTAVISLGQKLNMKVIAEGVENESQLEFLRDNNCDEIQGFHISEPVGADKIARMLTGQST
jgi:diguanylate cyclase (GGDEF)-like protein/PAS domain S-box-containing protein